MVEVFGDAARRLFKAADHMAGGPHYEIAGHLLGISAECAIKNVLRRAGVALGGKNDFRTHMPDLAMRLRQVNGGRALRHFKSDPAGLPFGNWCIDDRYAGDGAVQAFDVAGWHAGARILLRDSGIMV